MAGQSWSVAAEGGYMYSDELSDYLRMQAQPLTKFRQFCDAQDGAEKGLEPRRQVLLGRLFKSAHRAVVWMSAGDAGKRLHRDPALADCLTKPATRFRTPASSKRSRSIKSRDHRQDAEGRRSQVFRHRGARSVPSHRRSARLRQAATPRPPSRCRPAARPPSPTTSASTPAT
jgi:hypothetical protein